VKNKCLDNKTPVFFFWNAQYLLIKWAILKKDYIVPKIPFSITNQSSQQGWEFDK
jgi:hypothetical protein